MTVSELLALRFLDNPVSRWAVALATAAGVLALLFVAKRVLLARAARAAERTENRYDDTAVRVLEGTKTVALLAAALAAGARTLDLPERVDLWLGRGLVLIVSVQAGLWATHAVRLVFESRRAAAGDPPGAATAARAVAFVTRLVVWSLVVILVLSNFGVEVTTLVAGLGIGGIATALAVQNVLGDLFAAFSIYVDRPFDIGDFVIVDGFQGTVERIGWRSTQLASLSGEQIVLANSDLAQARIRNFKRMTARRVLVSFGVQYDTTPEQLARVTTIVREEVAKIDKLRLDRTHFMGFGDSALLFETVYFVDDTQYNAHMDRQERLLTALHRRLRDEGISFAFPTRTVHVHHEGAGLRTPERS